MTCAKSSSSEWRSKPQLSHPEAANPLPFIYPHAAQFRVGFFVDGMKPVHQVCQDREWVIDISADEGSVEIRAQNRSAEGAGEWHHVVPRLSLRMRGADLSGAVDETDRAFVR